MYLSYKSPNCTVSTCRRDLVFSRYEQLLLEQDPLPAYALRLLLALLEQNPGSAIRHVHKLNLLPVLFTVLMVSLYLDLVALLM